MRRDSLLFMTSFALLSYQHLLFVLPLTRPSKPIDPYGQGPVQLCQGLAILITQQGTGIESGGGGVRVKVSTCEYNK